MSVSTYRTDHKRRPHVVIEVTDNGPGMPPEVIDRARDPFFTTRPAGTGLGLAIVGRFVESHDGELQLTTRPAGGTVARILIPLRRASTLPPAPPPP